VLCVDVHDPNDAPLEVKFFGRELTAQPDGNFTIIALPDTQYYSQTYPEIFLSQTSWIVDNRENLNVVFVTHLGDVVQIGASQFEWDNAETAMSLLEDPGTTGLPEGIPYGICVGNHDQSPNNRAGSPEDDDETTQIYNEVFGVSRFEDRSYYGGHYSDNNDSHYELFSAGGMDFIIIHVEFDGTVGSILPDLIAWADNLLETYSDRRAIVASHSLLCTGTLCPESLDAPFSNQGQAMYDAFKDNPNLFLMLCGHAGVSTWQPRRTDTFDGNTIHTLLSNYQRFENCPLSCGNGYLRIYTLSPQNNEITAQTYSPWLDVFKTDIHHQFVLPYDMEGGVQFKELGSVSGVPSGMSACLLWPGRQMAAEYEWFVEASDGTSTVTSPRWTFTSDGACDLVADCDDQDICTAESCVSSGTCLNDPIADCCVSDADCDDADQCTDDVCSSNTCTHMYNVAPCSDGDPCTDNDTCFGGSCAGSPISCDDGNACTVNSCDDGACESAYLPSPGCCAGDVDCYDADFCTDDTCGVGGDCTNAAIPHCCVEDWHCDDADVCTDGCPQRNESALYLDGVNDHVTMGLPNRLGSPTGLNAATFTVECWFKWDGGGSPAKTFGWPFDSSDTGGIEAYPLVTKGREDREDRTERSVNYFLGILESGGVLAADFEEHGSGSNPGTNHPVTGTTVVSTGVWHHAAATYDGSCWQLYLDGIPETDGTNCPAEPPSYESLHHTAVGTAQNGKGWTSGRFSGFVDEVRIWTRALDQSEILANMSTQIVSDPDLMARWAFDEASGFVTDDSTGAGHVAVIVGGALDASSLVDLGGGVCKGLIVQEVADLLLDGASPTTLTWTDQGSSASFDVAGGLLSQLRSGEGTDLAKCLVSDEPTTGFIDIRPDPGSGDGYYYIVRSDDPVCGSSTYGFGVRSVQRSGVPAVRQLRGLRCERLLLRRHHRSSRSNAVPVHTNGDDDQSIRRGADGDSRR
jgi:hypothetical protein